MTMIFGAAGSPDTEQSLLALHGFLSNSNVVFLFLFPSTSTYSLPGYLCRYYCTLGFVIKLVEYTCGDSCYQEKKSVGDDRPYLLGFVKLTSRNQRRGKKEDIRCDRENSVDTACNTRRHPKHLLPFLPSWC